MVGNSCSLPAASNTEALVAIGRYWSKEKTGELVLFADAGMRACSQHAKVRSAFFA